MKLGVLLLGLLVVSGAVDGVAAQAAPSLDGTVLVGGLPMEDGVVVLHHLSEGTQGELDSLVVDGLGIERGVHGEARSRAVQAECENEVTPQSPRG